ncbi:MAG: hemolysin family protein [Proteobacteria bacterium]|nr:hemolysin family protein [Pseudomonadota bacterium]
MFFRRLKNGHSAGRLEEEIQDLIDLGSESGVITSNEGEMIQSIFELGDTVAREIMVPRISIVAAPADLPLGQIITMIMQKGHTRLPIYENEIDRIIGVLHAKDLLPYWGRSLEDPLPREIIRTPIFVPESKRVVDLLAELRAQKSHMAIIIDEYGGTAGLITLEDIIEEIVGEIHDEYDQEEDLIVPVDEYTFLVDARLNIEELEDLLKIEFPEGDYETVGGFLTDLTGRVPQESERIEYADLLITILSADERKINQVEVKRLVDSRGLSTGTA